jgi:hypothetical protein
MRRLIDRCAGIDVGQALLVVCVRVVDEDGKVLEQVRSSGDSSTGVDQFQADPPAVAD